MERKRYSHIDLLETIAIFFVIMYHSTLYVFDITESGTMLNYARYFARTILSTCVPLFFFANGYLLFNRNFDLKRHIKKTFRLVVLVFVWGVILMPIYMLISGEAFSVKVFLLSIFNLSIPWGMNLFWFIGALVCMYLLFPALKASYDTDRRAFLFFTLACFALTFGFVAGNQFLEFTGMVLHHKFTSMNYSILTMYNPFRGSYGYSFVYFCVGGLLYTYENKILQIPRRKRNCLAVAGMMLSCSFLFLIGVFYSKYYDGKMWDVVWNGYDTIFTFINVICIYVLCLSYNGKNKYITAISVNTLGIYFTHGLIIRLTRPWMKTIPALCNYTVNLLYAFFILCICLLICILIKKIPLLKKLV